MPERRFELLHLSALPPQDSVSTNSTTRAPKITVHPVKTPVPNRENRRTRTFDPLLKRQLLYQLSYILNRTLLYKTECSQIVICSGISSASYDGFYDASFCVCAPPSYDVFFSFRKAYSNDFTLVLKANNIRAAPIKCKHPCKKLKTTVNDQKAKKNLQLYALT